MFSPVELVKKEIAQVKQAEKQVLEDISQAESEAEWIVKKAKEKGQKEAEGIRQQALDEIHKLLKEAETQAKKEAKKIDAQGRKTAERIKQGAAEHIGATATKVVDILLE